MDEGLIDTVAREMTGAMPPADLRARVLSRIAHGERTKKALVWRLAPAAIALAAAAALVADRLAAVAGRIARGEPVGPNRAAVNRRARGNSPRTRAGPYGDGRHGAGSGAADSTRRP